MWAAIVAAGSQLIQGVLTLISDSQTADAAAHQTIMDRLAASKASLAGDKTDAHQAIEADLAATQAQLDALKATHAKAIADLQATLTVKSP